MTLLLHAAVAFGLLLAIIVACLCVARWIVHQEDKPDAKGQDPSGDAGE